MHNLKDIWHEPYLNPDGSINPECRLFVGWSQQAINYYLYEPRCLLGEKKMD